MCGLVGFLDFRKTKTELELRRTVERMATLLVHRGPDDSGAWCSADDGIALGHRRLAIIDLSPSGHQPMHSQSGLTVVFNGEIYNYRQLRRELEGRGYPFRTHSDTEVILAAVDTWGLHRALQRFNGMFALALWNRSERALYLARDRFGEKPMYVAAQGDLVLFASELKAFHAHPDWSPRIDAAALREYVRFGYVPAPRSIYDGVRKLAPGTWLRVATRPDVERRPTPYWSLLEVVHNAASRPFRGTDQEAVDELDSLTRDSVRLRLVADVPLGAFLSGGIDSSTVVALMQSASDRPIRTFTIGFDEAEYDEASSARAIASHLGTEHTELIVTPQEARAVIPQLPLLYDEPFADSSQIPTYLVAKLARSQVTVALSGDGGDELFAGYTRYGWGASLWRYAFPLPRRWRHGLAAAIETIHPLVRDDQSRQVLRLLPARLRVRNVGSKLQKLAELLRVGHDQADLYRQLVSSWPSSEAVVLDNQSSAALPVPWEDLQTITQGMMYADGVRYLPDDILVKLDRATMGVSLEGRVPFLDHRLAEFVWSLPMRHKVRRRQRKWALRRLLSRYVPTKLFERPKKGFTLPVDAWLREPLRDWAESYLDPSRLKVEGHFNHAVVRRRWDEHLSGARNWQGSMWTVLMFQLWLAHWRRPSLPPMEP